MKDDGGEAVDGLLGIIGMFDWITPLAAIVMTVLHGGGTMLSVPQSWRLSRPEVKQILKSHGIEAWGLEYSGSSIVYWVRPRDAQAADAVWLPMWRQHGAGGGGGGIVIVLGIITGIAGYLWLVGML